MNVAEYAVQNISLVGWVWIKQAHGSIHSATRPQRPDPKVAADVLQPLRRWLDTIEVHEPKLAHRLCQVIPAQCPFERNVKFCGYTLFHLPPLCKLNPLYSEIVGLRFRALCYLADDCGEDVTPYC